MHSHWHFTSLVDLWSIETNSLRSNLLCAVTNAPDVTTLYPFCARAMRTLNVDVVNFTLWFFSSLHSGENVDFSDKIQNSIRQPFYWHSISVVDLCSVQTNSLWSNLLCPVTNAPDVTTLYPICSRALRTLNVGVANSTLRFFSSLHSGEDVDFSAKTRNSFRGRPSTVQLKRKWTYN